MFPTRRPRRPRAHWVVLVVVLLGCLALLFISGITSGQVGESAEATLSRAAAGRVPTDIASGGPIVGPARPEEPGLSVPRGHVVLTFDDGPTKWTDEILDVLDARGVKATFFVIGSRVAEDPDTVRRMRAER